MKKLGMMALGFGAAWLVMSPGFSQQQSALTAEKIAGNIYIVKGGVANTGFVVGEKAVAAIDAEMTADSATQMIEQIRKVTSLPLTTLILTHSDGDHVNGLAGFPQGLEEVKTAFGIPPAPEKPGGLRFPSLVEVIYLELSGK